jgi:hypothetical protein
MTNVLTLTERRVRRITWKKRFPLFRTAQERAEVHLDFVIDGKPLRARLQEWQEADSPPEEVSLLTQAEPKLAAEQIDRLLGHRPHQYWGRGWLLFCPACWDEGCGGMTADIRHEAGKVYWSGIGWDDSFTPDAYRIENAVDFVFDEVEYERVLLEAREWVLARRLQR